MANVTTLSTENQQDSNKKKGFEEGLANNSTTAGNTKTDLQLEQPSAQGLNKNAEKQNEGSEDNTALQDDEEVGKQ